MIVADNAPPLIFAEKVIKSGSILPKHQKAESIVFDSCTSDDWVKIGKVLASLPHLYTLAFVKCKTRNEIFKELRKSPSLLSLRIGSLE